jgi:hypothetical protein
MSRVLSHLIPVHPEKFTKLISNPISDAWTSAGLKRLLLGVDYPHEFIGVIVAAGNMEIFQINGNASNSAGRCDAVVVWFNQYATWPKLAKEVTRVNVAQDIASVTAYAELHFWMKMFIQGIEDKTSRRVLAVGGEITNEKPLTDPRRLETKWIAVPLSEVERDKKPIL